MTINEKKELAVYKGYSNTFTPLKVNQSLFIVLIVQNTTAKK